MHPLFPSPACRMLCLSNLSRKVKGLQGYQQGDQVMAKCFLGPLKFARMVGLNSLKSRGAVK